MAYNSPPIRVRPLPLSGQDWWLGVTGLSKNDIFEIHLKGEKLYLESQPFTSWICWRCLLADGRGSTQWEHSGVFILVTAGRESERQKRAEASFLFLKAHPDGRLLSWASPLKGSMAP